MITHYIIMSSSYSKGKRIAIDNYFTDNEKETKIKSLKEILNIITDKCGKDVSISTHFIQTDSESWDSVVKKDHFFKDVEVEGNVYEFIELIQKDRTLFGIDIAKYILSKKERCTHLKLEKMVYLCYADYLCEFKKKLFTDEIYAYKYGPVEKSVYEKFKKYGYEEIDKKEIDSNGISEMPSRSRILFAEDGINKIKSIDKTIDKYGKFSANKLVRLTHKPNTPWYLSGRGNDSNRVIDDAIILEYHCNELV